MQHTKRYRSAINTFLAQPTQSERLNKVARMLAEAEAWMRRYEHFWNDRLDTLEALLRAEDTSRAKKQKD